MKEYLVIEVIAGTKIRRRCYVTNNISDVPEYSWSTGTGYGVVRYMTYRPITKRDKNSIWYSEIEKR